MRNERTSTSDVVVESLARAFISTEHILRRSFCCTKLQKLRIILAPWSHFFAMPDDSWIPKRRRKLKFKPICESLPSTSFAVLRNASICWLESYMRSFSPDPPSPVKNTSRPRNQTVECMASDIFQQIVSKTKHPSLRPPRLFPCARWDCIRRVNPNDVPDALH